MDFFTVVEFFIEGHRTSEDLLAVFNKKGLFVDFESRNGKLRGLFPKSDSNKVMYPCSVCCLEVTNRNDTTGLGIECGGCGWYFHSKCTEKPLSLELFKALKDSPNYVKVLCPPCNSVYGMVVHIASSDVLKSKLNISVTR